MSHAHVYHGRSARVCVLRSRVVGLTLSWMFLSLLSGCAALTNPVADGIPVHRLPPDALGDSKQDKYTIDLSLLRQKPPDTYRLEAGDVLGIYVEGVLPATAPGQVPPIPPVYFPAQVNSLGRRLPPAVGFPFQVHEDGTVAPSLLPAVSVKGLTIAEAEEKIRALYLEKKLLGARASVLVTLMQQRQYRVLVVRQETGGFTSAAAGGLVVTSTKRGNGNTIDLAAYENDVLSALNLTGGLPGLDAYNRIIIFKVGSRPSSLRQKLEANPNLDPRTLATEGEQIIDIPMRIRKGEELPIREEDIILQTGDIVFLEGRDREVFYAGGLLPPGEYTLPRDYDLDVVKAISFVKGPLVNGASATSNLSGGIIATGVGNPSPSLLTVLRRTKDGGQINIRVDLNRALRDPREKVLVQANDILILQETPEEALTRYATQVFRFDFLFTMFNRRDGLGTAAASVP